MDVKKRISAEISEVILVHNRHSSKTNNGATKILNLTFLN